ncbi:MAG TPA: flagellar basal-body rod protein FlgF [Pseudorhodoplanes sp.]|jgi:flagellar basal-body rod protein FlgF|nr:flagellar basal-body rod protein FlgF [Pseudorhodoplanes sp.]
MENVLLIGLSRQMSLHREIDVVANNIANLNTTGFKADNAVFEEYLMPGARAGQFAPPDRRMSYVQDRQTWHDLSQGPVEATGNPLDVAIDGEGFLVVQTPRGERYTRNGALQLNANGQLVTSEGYAVMGEAGPITLQSTDKDIMITREGTITVREGANTTSDAIRGKLRLVTFAPNQPLRKDAGSTFAAAQGVQPQPVASPRIVQGSIEKSNVRSIVEMTRMIEVTRNYTQVANILQTQNDMRRNAIDKLAEVPA